MLAFLSDIVPAPGIAKIFNVSYLAITAGVVVLALSGTRLAGPSVAYRKDRAAHHQYSI